MAQGGAPPPLTGGPGLAQGPLLANPLTLRVTSLRRPQLWLGGSQSIECAEEGDILYGALREQQQHGDGWGSGGVHPVLAFPASVGKHFVGEYLRAYLSFRNTAGYHLTRLQVKCELTTPRGKQLTLYAGETPRLDPLTNKDVKVEMQQRFAEAGKYSLSVSAAYTDMTYEQKRLAMNYNIMVETAVKEVGRRIVVLPPRSGGSSSSSGGVAAVTAVSAAPQLPPVYGVSVTLENVASECPMVLTMVHFRPADGFSVLAADGQPVTEAPKVVNFAGSYSGGGRDELADAHLYKGDTRQFYFEVAQHQLLTRRSSAAAYGVELGCVQWEWRRENGDSGVIVSEPFKLQHPRGIIPELSVEVADIAPPVPRVARPVTLTLRLRNFSASRRDVTLAVLTEKMGPTFAYAGLCLRPLGIVEPNGGDLEFSISVIPLQAGVVSVSGIFEFHDDAQRLLWPIDKGNSGPLAAATTGDASTAQAPSSSAFSSRSPAASPTSSSSAARSGLTAAAAAGSEPLGVQPRPDPFPPVLCELYVEPQWGSSDCGS